MKVNKFDKRSSELELMDLPIDRKEELFINLRELEFINKLTGGPSLGFSAIKKMLAGRKEEVHIVDIGFGAGDMLKYILEHTDELSCPVRLTGVDLLPETAEYAVMSHPSLKDKVRFEICDYRKWFSAGHKADLIIASLFCHHLSDDDIIAFFERIKLNAAIGGVINDLVRSPIAWYGIKIPTQIFSRSGFTKNDAPLSVLKGFKRSELEGFLREAGIKNYSLEWRWAFRFLVSIIN